MPLSKLGFESENTRCVPGVSLRLGVAQTGCNPPLFGIRSDHHFPPCTLTLFGSQVPSPTLLLYLHNPQPKTQGAPT